LYKNNGKSISRKEITRRVVIVLFLVYFLFLIIHIYNIMSSNDNFGYKAAPMDKGWSVMVDGKEYNNVDLDDFLPEKTLKRGDIVIIRNVIPEDIGNPAVVRLETYLATVDVYVDNKIVYSYGEGEYKSNSSVGSGLNFIYLPDNSGGKSFAIKLKVAENDGFTNISAPFICHGNAGFIDYFRRNVLTILCGLFLLMLGIVITIPCLIIELKKGYMHRLTLIGLFSFCIGLWTCCNSRALQLFSLDITDNTILEYCALYFAPIPFSLLMATVQNDDIKWKKILMNIIMTGFTAFPVVALLLHITNIVHLPLMIRPFHMITFILMIFLLFVGVSGRIKTDETKLLNFGMIMIISIAALDIVRFNIQKYLAPELSVLRISLLSFGVVLFAIILILSYLTYLYGVLMERASNETLRIMAYHDQLTGLYNRAKFDEVIEELRVRHNIDYCLILFDLDRLKKVNDTYGHSVGDKLIKSFSDNLTESFKKYSNAIIMRIGGDEFVIILNEISDEELKTTMDELHNMNIKSSNELGFKVSASYGFCTGKFSKSEDPMDTYKIADSYMYNMKGTDGYTRE